MVLASPVRRDRGATSSFAAAGGGTSFSTTLRSPSYAARVTRWGAAFISHAPFTIVVPSSAARVSRVALADEQPQGMGLSPGQGQELGHTGAEG